MGIYYESYIMLVKLSDLKAPKKRMYEKGAYGIITDTVLGFKEIKTDTLINYQADKNHFIDTKFIEKKILSKDVLKKLENDGAILIVETNPRVIKNIDTVKSYFKSFDKLNIKKIIDEYNEEVELYKNKKRDEKKEKYIKIRENLKIYADVFKEMKSDLSVGKEIKKLVKEYKKKENK